MSEWDYANEKVLFWMDFNEDFEWVCSTITSQNIYGCVPTVIRLAMRPSRLFKSSFMLYPPLGKDQHATLIFTHANELTDEDERDGNEVNTGDIIVKDVPGSLEVRSGNSFQAEPPTNSSVLTTKN
ncbi:hypothetical protein TNCV_1387161 [Trichonephila clavipes]|nr:hypothetical protein TNCV_1387161 [Trichonephila clavipes]